MKKLALGICALIACFVFASCSHDPSDALDKMKDLKKKAEKVKTADEYLDVYEEFMETAIDFYKGNPSKSQIEKYWERRSEVRKALREAENDFKKAEKKKMEELGEDKSTHYKLVKLERELEDAMWDYEYEKNKDKKKNKKDKDDDDDDDDDE